MSGLRLTPRQTNLFQKLLKNHILNSDLSEEDEDFALKLSRKVKDYQKRELA